VKEEHHMTQAAARFALHYAEMVGAMFLGMLVLYMPVVMALEGAGLGESQDWAIELRLLGMAITMTLPMAAWMRVRGHGPRPIMEMSAAMFLPTFGAIALFWAALVEDTDTLMALEHVAMFAAMLGAMLLRPAEYTGHAHHGATA
jgi:hypothetical protein